MISSFIDWSTFDDSRFKGLLSKSSFCDDNDDESETSVRDDDFERDEYSTSESKRTSFLNDCKVSDALKSMSN